MAQDRCYVQCLQHGSLCSGFGGFDLAAQWAGWNNVFHCEINPFAQRILKYYWPNAASYSDLFKTNFSTHAGKINVLSAGFPCQPFSTAGEQRGEADERFIFPECIRALREIKPEWFVAENVYGLATAKFRPTLEKIYSCLESEGYEVLPPIIIPASAVDAPHERYRIWIVAHTNSYDAGRPGPGEIGRKAGTLQEKQKERERLWSEFKRISEERAIANATSCGRLQSSSKFGSEQFTQGIPDWRRFPTQSPVCGRNDGFPGQLDGVTIPNWRRESIKGFGNAIVPQEAFEIFKVIATMSGRHCT